MQALKLPTNSIVHNITDSLLIRGRKIDDRHIVAPKKIIERSGEQRLGVLASLGLNKPDTAPEAVRQISPDMHLRCPACRSGGCAGLGRRFRSGNGWRGCDGRAATGRAIKPGL
jgi:hypothetical protein